MTGVLTTPAKIGVVNSSLWRSSPRVGRRREDIKSNAVARFSGMRRSPFKINLIFFTKKEEKKEKKEVVDSSYKRSRRCIRWEDGSSSSTFCGR